MRDFLRGRNLTVVKPHLRGLPGHATGGIGWKTTILLIGAAIMSAVLGWFWLAVIATVGSVIGIVKISQQHLWNVFSQASKWFWLTLILIIVGIIIAAIYGVVPLIAIVICTLLVSLLFLIVYKIAIFLWDTILGAGYKFWAIIFSIIGGLVILNVSGLATLTFVCGVGLVIGLGVFLLRTVVDFFN